MASTEKRLRTPFLAGALMLVACGGADTTTTLPPPSSGVSTTTSAGATTTASTATTTAPTTTGLTTTTSTTTTAPPDTTTTTSTVARPPGIVTLTVDVEDGEVSGPGRVTVPLGSQLRLTVTSDEADEVHFHGYDVFANVAPGAPAVLLLVADIPGVFEVELEGRGLELVIVEVK